MLMCYLFLSKILSTGLRYRWTLIHSFHDGVTLRCWSRRFDCANSNEPTCYVSDTKTTSSNSSRNVANNISKWLYWRQMNKRSLIVHSKMSNNHTFSSKSRYVRREEMLESSFRLCRNGKKGGMDGRSYSRSRWSAACDCTSSCTCDSLYSHPGKCDCGKTLNDFYSCSVCFHRGLESYQHGTMSAIVSLLCISMFAVLWYMWVRSTSLATMHSKKVPCRVPLSHLRTMPHHPQGAPGGPGLLPSSTHSLARHDFTGES